MNSDERSLLQQFLGDLVATRGAIKDQEADRMINDALRRNPDGAYVLVQHAVMSDQALHAAQGQIAQLQDQLRQANPSRQSSNFLPSSGPWSGGQQQGQPQSQGGGFMGSGPLRGGGGLGSFLRNAGTTAAGVVGGSLLFEGLSGLFGGGRGGFGGFGGGGGWGGQPTEVVNNYYDDGGAGGGGDFGGGDFGGGDFGGGDGGGFDNSGGGGDF